MDGPGPKDAGNPGMGLFDSLKGLLATLIAIVHNRLELLSTELQEEIERVALLLLWGAMALFFAFLGITFIGLLVVIAFWDEHRLLAAALLAGLFVALALVAAVAAWKQIGTKPRPFDASLSELVKDRDHLAPRR
jgi:uncharacterized membrane protein YqjE